MQMEALDTLLIEYGIDPADFHPALVAAVVEVALLLVLTPRYGIAGAAWACMGAYTSMFLLMVRVTDPLIPRMMFGLLNTVLYFPSGAVYPQQGFPGWMHVIAVVDPFTYSVHAFKSLLLKNTGFGAIAGDVTFLLIFSIVAMTAATMLFKRTL